MVFSDSEPLTYFTFLTLPGEKTMLKTALPGPVRPSEF